MLFSTFIHFKNISPEKEKKLWKRGILTWDDFEKINPHQLSMFSDEKSSIDISKKALKEKNINYFAELLPQSEYYRIALTFPEEVIFLDIETTGLSKYYHLITMAGWSYKNLYEKYISGEDSKKLLTSLEKSKIIVTFNGTLFDLPFLKRFFNDIKIPKCHIDLRFFSRRVDLIGGQKEIEKNIGLKRPKEITGLEGESDLPPMFDPNLS
jgi:uncharacterized protein YprB with RNaseH-like and TPR domain